MKNHRGGSGWWAMGCAWGIVVALAVAGWKTGTFTLHWRYVLWQWILTPWIVIAPLLFWIVPRIWTGWWKHSLRGILVAMGSPTVLLGPEFRIGPAWLQMAGALGISIFDTHAAAHMTLVTLMTAFPFFLGAMLLSFGVERINKTTNGCAGTGWLMVVAASSAVLVVLAVGTDDHSLLWQPGLTPWGGMAVLLATIWIVPRITRGWLKHALRTLLITFGVMVSMTDMGRSTRGIVLGLVFLVVLLLSVGTERVRYVRPPHLCPDCGYDLPGNPAAATCPECGAARAGAGC